LPGKTARRRWLLTRRCAGQFMFWRQTAQTIINRGRIDSGGPKSLQPIALCN
jgi:hypothetical protein